jgi:hypothetical protein
MIRPVTCAPAKWQCLTHKENVDPYFCMSAAGQSEATVDRLICMSYELSWHTPNRVILLRLFDLFTLTDAVQINAEITAWLDASNASIFLLVDAQDVTIPLLFEEIRSSQSFMNHRHLRHIFIVSDKKMTRLFMLVMYNLATAFVRLFNTREAVEEYLELRLSRSH